MVKLLRNTCLCLAVAFAEAVLAIPGNEIAKAPSTAGVIPTKSLGVLSLSKPGFAAVIPENGKKSLYVSTFHAFGSDAVYKIEDIGSVTKSTLQQFSAKEVGGSVTWPNDLTQAPKEVFGAAGVVVASGFLVPGKSNGGIYYLRSTPLASGSGEWQEVFSKPGWFYHRAVFTDIDRDGRDEIVTCRARKGLLGGSDTMLVYLKPKTPGKIDSEWVETEIGPGCDALFAVADLDADGIPEVIAASFFTSQLNVFYSKSSTGFAKSVDVKKVMIDASIGAAFDVQVTDINGDGKPDLLVSNHQGGSSNPSGSVYAYEIPSDITQPKAYKRHTLASGFPVTRGGFNQASPGSPVAFHPTPATQGGPAYIALAGDAAQIAYVLVPGSTPWSYQVTALHDCGCTVGKLAVADVDGDGYQEVFIPCYDKDTLAAYSFKP